MWNVSSIAAALALAATLAAPSSLVAEPRPIALDDMNSILDVSDVQIAPDGRWVVYSVEKADLKRDRHDEDLYMTSWDGVTTVRLTSSPEGEHAPRFSPDGRFIGFLT
jgi:dipeptidyl aminopeptidase/acylaminoacyl peptidase